MRFVGAFLVLAALTGCVNQPQTFAPPVQRKPVLDGDAPKAAKQIVDMIDPDTDSAIVQDIPRGANGPWRWTGKKPTVRIFATRTDGLKLKVHYTISDSTYKDTGPVTFTFLVNGEMLDAVKQTTTGEKFFEKAVPASMLRLNSDNFIAIEVDKVWTSPSDGAQLGFILSSVELAH